MTVEFFLAYALLRDEKAGRIAACWQALEFAVFRKPLCRKAAARLRQIRRMGVVSS